MQAIIMKFMKITSSSRENWKETQNAQKDKKLVFQKNRIQTCINPY